MTTQLKTLIGYEYGMPTFQTFDGTGMLKRGLQLHKSYRILY